MNRYFENIKLDKNLPVPLYRQLKEAILALIFENIIKVDESIPTEMEISNTLNISRFTVRQSMEELVEEGYLFRRKRKGTFVSKPKINEGFLQKLDSFEHEMELKGLKPRTAVNSFKVIQACEKINNMLNMNSDGSLIYLERVRYANEEPIVYLETYLPYKGLKELLNENFIKSSLYHILESKYDLRVTKAVRKIEAVNANTKEARLLNISINDAICLVKTTAYTKDGIPVEYSVARYRGDRNEFTVELLR